MFKLWCKWFHHLRVTRRTLLGAPYDMCLQCGRTYTTEGKFILKFHPEQLIR